MVCAGLLAVLGAGLAVTAAFFDFRGLAYLLATFTEEHVLMLDMFDNRGQQAAYRLFLALVGVFAVAVWYFRPRPIPLMAPEWLHHSLHCVNRNSGSAVLALLIPALWFNTVFSRHPACLSCRGNMASDFSHRDCSSSG